jgi:two-component system alkaline phosphatase synthesis response regulator PhoP
MTRALVIARDTASKAGLNTTLAHDDLSCLYTCYNNGFRQALLNEKPEALLVEIADHLPDPPMWELIRKVKKERNVPVIALVTRQELSGTDLDPDIDDFLVAPYDATELLVRVKRLIDRADRQAAAPIKGNGLFIDPDTCEVTIDSSKVELTFKEYELLKLLAGHKGHVFTREALLDKIWGYDYYGGDRTVDVHVRRLRSKIERNHTYIETVRNIGYRFIKDE